jgi:hypothetical protein
MYCFVSLHVCAGVHLLMCMCVCVCGAAVDMKDPADPSQGYTIYLVCERFDMDLRKFLNGRTACGKLLRAVARTVLNCLDLLTVVAGRYRSITGVHNRDLKREYSLFGTRHPAPCCCSSSRTRCPEAWRRRRVVLFMVCICVCVHCSRQSAGTDRR